VKTASLRISSHPISHLEAFGEGQKHDLLGPMIESTRSNFQAIGKDDDAVFKSAKLSADSGFHTEANMQRLFEENIDAYVADKLFRQRDPRFAGPTSTRNGTGKTWREKQGGVVCLQARTLFSLRISATVFAQRARNCIEAAVRQRLANFWQRNSKRPNRRAWPAHFVPPVSGIRNGLISGRWPIFMAVPPKAKRLLPER